MKRVLALSAETPSAVALVRGLHKSGLEAAALVQSFLSPAGLSWRCGVSQAAPNWTSEELPALVREVRADVVIPVTEGDLLRLASVRAEVEALAPVVSFPESVLRAAMDKAHVAEVAARLGIDVPEQIVLDGDVTPAALALLPAVAKPAVSRALQPDGSVWAGTARYVATEADLVQLRATHAAAGVRTLVQRPVRDGQALLVSVLAGPQGERRLVFAHERVREMLPEGGPSACAVSTVAPPELVDASFQLAAELGLVGAPAQFEYRLRPLGLGESRAMGEGAERAVLLDINPRPWGTLGLALDCGVNFYAVAARMRLGEPPPSTATHGPPAYRSRVVRHYLPFELRRSWAVLRGHRQPGYDGPWPSRGEALSSWAVLPHQGLVFRLDDPLPAVGDALRLALRALRG